MDGGAMGVWDEGTARTGLSRRDLIKRAAAAGAVAWTAPVIVDSLASPAGALTGQSGCMKFQYDWVWAPVIANCQGTIGSKGMVDGQTCAQNLGESIAESSHVSNPNCCEWKKGDGNVYQWWELEDTPAGLVSVAPNTTCASSTTGVTVTFSINPAYPDCYLAEGVHLYEQNVLYDNVPGVLAPDTCGSLSLAGWSSFASSKLYKSVTLSYTGNKVPVSWRFWVACGIADDPGGDNYYPDTDCQFYNVNPDSPLSF